VIEISGGGTELHKDATTLTERVLVHGAGEGTLEALEQSHPNLRVAGFSSAELKDHLYLVSLIEKLLCASYFCLEVVIPNLGSHLYFFDSCSFLPIFFSSLLLFILQLSIVDNSANRRICIGRHLD